LLVNNFDLSQWKINLSICFYFLPQFSYYNNRILFL
jgi:hypothetical protein